MTSDWRPRHGSKRSLLLITLLWAVCSVPTAASGEPTAIIRAERGATAEELDFLARDGRWLRGLPAGQRKLAEVSTDSLEAGDQAAWADLRRAIETARTPADSTGLRTPASRLRERWIDRGYLDAHVTTRGDTLFVDPGPIWIVGRFDVEGPDFDGRTHLLGTWLPRTGDRFARANLAEGVASVLRGCGEAGFPFARWVMREMTADSAAAAIHLKARLLPGKRAFIGPVTTNLERERAAGFLSRAAGLRRGDLFRESDLERAVQRLQARDLYLSVGTPEVYLTSAADTIGIHLPVVPRRNANRLAVILGLSRGAEGESARLSGEVDLSLPNMAGSGRGLRVGWRDDGLRRSRFGFSYLEPLIAGTPLDMGVSLDNEIEKDSYTRFRVDSVWRLPVVALWGVEVGAGWDRATYPLGELERTSRIRARGAFSHKRGDRTRSGWEGLFAIETGWRSASLRPPDEAEPGTSSRLAEAVTQRIFEVDTAGEIMLAGTLSVFTRASFRQLTGGDAVVPLSEQFRFGGAASLRGYREDEFHGSAAAWGAVEMRIGRPLGSRLYTFYDVGYFEFASPDPLGQEVSTTRGWPKGYGLGLLAKTRAGDISLAVGFPGTVDFDQAKLHVTLLESF